MASNKNQHFVPRCYLRHFSIGLNKKTINLFNIDSERVIECAAIKHQCSRDYFYGRDDSLERAIQSVENAYAHIIGRLLRYNAPVSQSDKELLLRFFLLQNTRTEAASRRAVEMSNGASDVAGLEGQEFKMEIKDAVQISLSIFAAAMDYIDDLNIVLVKNKSSIPFVTSDDPAISVSRLAFSNKIYAKFGVGIKSAGLICVIPLSPDTCCIAYDKDVYSIPQKNNWTTVRSVHDINAINDLQYMNCFANIYFDNKSFAPEIKAIHARNAGYRPDSRHRINYAIPEEHSNGFTKYVVVNPKEAPEHGEALIHIENVPIKPLHWPKFLRWKRHGYVFSNGSGAGYLRHAHVPEYKSPPFKKIKLKH